MGFEYMSYDEKIFYLEAEDIRLGITEPVNASDGPVKVTSMSMLLPGVDAPIVLSPEALRFFITFVLKHRKELDV